MLPISVDLSAAPRSPGRRRGGSTPPAGIARRGRRRRARNLCASTPTRRSPERPAPGCSGVCRCPPRSRGRSSFLSPALPIRPRPTIRGAAQAAGVLINVEDDRRRSDFHSAAVIPARRPDRGDIDQWQEPRSGSADAAGAGASDRAEVGNPARRDRRVAPRLARGRRRPGGDRPMDARMGRPARLARPGVFRPFPGGIPRRYPEPAANCCWRQGNDSYRDHRAGDDGGRRRPAFSRKRGRSAHVAVRPQRLERRARAEGGDGGGRR